MRKLKKGFTLVELVIVIAVIAVLTAVLVPTFIHLTKKARDASDKTVVKNANIQLASQEQSQGKNKSMSDAVKDVDEIGYHIPGVATGNGNKIVWDRNTDRFVLLDKDDKVLHSDAGVSVGTTLSQSEKANYFYAVSSLEDRGDFAIYAKSDFEVHENVPTKSFSFTSPVSFDAGDREGEDLKIESISYKFNDSANVLVATNSQDTVLTVECPEAEFEHEGLVGKEIITAVKGSSFVEYGKVGFVQITQGHYVADQGADVKAIYLTDDTAKVDRENGGIILKAYGKNADVKNENHNVELEINGDAGAVEEAAMDALDKDVNPEPPVSGTPINNFSELALAIATGGDYYLATDITMIGSIDMVADTIDCKINLNGHTWYIGDGIVPLTGGGVYCYINATKSGQKLTIDDNAGGGQIIYQNEGSHPDAIFGFCGGSTLVFNGGTYVSLTDTLFGGVGGNFIYNGGSLLGYIGTCADSTLTFNDVITIKAVNDMLPFAWLGNTVNVGEGLQKSITGTNDEYSVIKVTRTL